MQPVPEVSHTRKDHLRVQHAQAGVTQVGSGTVSGVTQGPVVPPWCSRPSWHARPERTSAMAPRRDPPRQ